MAADSRRLWQPGAGTVTGTQRPAGPAAQVSPKFKSSVAARPGTAGPWQTAAYDDVAARYLQIAAAQGLGPGVGMGVWLG